jgi:non-ribosomal peptide synthetase-like protein
MSLFPSTTYSFSMEDEGRVQILHPGSDSSRAMTDSRILTGDAPFNAIPTTPASVTTLPQLFRHQAETNPGSIAFSVQTDHGLKTTTYAEADSLATSIAISISSLSRASGQNEVPTVGIWLEKGLDLVLAILATTYSGATWLPLDPDVPVERAAVCVLDAGATVLISDAAHADQVQQLRCEVDAQAGTRALHCCTFTELSKEARAGNRLPSMLRPFLNGPRPQDAAYLIYTSGTTGTPKGIAISQSAALTFSLSEREVLGTRQGDIVWNGFSPAFDMFVEEMWVTVAGGGHLAIGTRSECRDVPGLPAIWANRGVTIVNAVPTLIGIMDIARSDDSCALLPQSIRLINLGGEACPQALVSRLARPGLRIVNTYGPTETTVTATWDELQVDVPVTIGKPLPGYHACLLPISEDDTSNSLSPLELSADAEGELAIGGPCVGIGYVGRPELTAQKFIKHPLFPAGGERLYRTGDRVRLQADGKIVFLGRIDTQVKHRGFRIELGEIESKLYSVPDVQAAAVILANSGSDAARLEAFVVVRPQAARDTTAIDKLAFQTLPAYMRPEEIFFLEADEMPRLASGKINSKALQDVSARKASERAVVRPSEDSLSVLRGGTYDDSPLGMLLTELAVSFPQARHIKPQTDIFMELGCHSLSAAKLVSRLRQLRCAKDGSTPFASIGLADIYEGRSAASISARFNTLEKGHDVQSHEIDDLEETDNTGPWTGDFLPISQTKFALCGLAQIVPILFLFFVYSVEFLVPYLVFDFHALRGRIGWAILAAYGVFVVIPPILSMMAIVAKWLLLGKVKPGEYPLYGVFYFRWWLAERLTALVNVKLIADSALYPFFLRAMGSEIGAFCHLGTMSVGACGDLVEIGNDVVIGADVVLAVSLVERGRLILKKVTIHDGAIIGSHCVIEGGATIGEGAEIASLSLVPDGMDIPGFQRFHGSPARLEREIPDDQSARARESRPSKARAMAMLLGNIFAAGFVLPCLYFVPQIPGLLLFDVLDIKSITGWDQVAILAIPIALAYQFLVFGQLLLFRNLFLGRLKEGTYKIHSLWYLRKWFIERLMDLALDVLHPVFATLYIVPFLKLLGVKIGKRAEVSTARSLQFELLEIGEESFVADAVITGGAEVRNNELTLKKTTLEPRAFAGNASVLPQGTTLASGTLLGVLSIAPSSDTPMANNSSCFGSPPVLMPNRQRVEGHDDSLLFRPSKSRVAARLFIEGLRIVLPRALMIFGLGFGLQLAHDGYRKIGAVYTLLMLPLFYVVLFAMPALFFTALLKWTLIGVYKPAEWPLWSLNVWLSEAVTSTWETITEPLLASLLVGTPYLAWCFRLMGANVGARVTLLSSDITEYDCVSIGDEAIVNQSCGAQTHLFEDRVMKVGQVTMGRRSCAKPYSICLPGSSISDGAQLGSLSLLMKGECLPEYTAWEGAPVVPRARRLRKAAKES